MSRCLVCLFTFNRPGLMLNAVRSVERFLPGCAGVVFDDGSFVPGAAEALAQVGREYPNWDTRTRERGDTVGLQGLYRNMADALALAIADGYDHCLFLEDDTQLVWQKAGQLNELDTLFDACPDAVQLQPLLYRRLNDYRETMEYVRTARAYRTIQGFNTTAFWNMRVVREHADYAVIHAHRGSNLALNSAYWLKRGYRLYADARPNMAIIPWVTSHSAGVKTTTGLRAGAADTGLLLEPLTPGEVAALQQRPPHRLAMQEHFALSADNCRRPVWHRRGEMMGLYYERCYRAVNREDSRGESPINVTTVADVSACKLGPRRSHLDWRLPAPDARPARRGLRPVVSACLPRWAKAGARRWAAHLAARAKGHHAGYRELCRRMRREQAELRDAADRATPPPH
ncbi:MAG: hypothetical protein ACIAXF_10315 [Phycisphaerales bacterium JB063]